MSTTQGTVGFIGLGNMGAPMAHNLAEAGFRLVVRDAAPEAEERFVQAHAGAVRGTDPAAFADADFVVTMLPNGLVVQDALLSWQGGIAAALPAGALVIDMSSSNPTDTLELAKGLAASSVRLVDAPVSGGVPRATTGELSIMVGGDPEDVDRAQPLLGVMGDPARQFRTGTLGTGHALKALNNYIAAATYCATAEALVVGKTFGLDTGVMIDTVNTSTGRSFVSEVVFGQEAVTGRYATGFQLGLLAKDVHIAADVAKRLGVEAPMADLADEMWAKALADVGPTADHSAAHRAWWTQDIARD